MMPNKYSVLFVCQANRFRSPLAEKIFLQQLSETDQLVQWQVSSAGTWTSNGLPVTKEALPIAKQWGLDLVAHKSRCIDECLVSEYQLIIVMEHGQKEALLTEFPYLAGKVVILSEAAGKPAFDVPDPYAKDENPEIIANEIKALIRLAHQWIVAYCLKAVSRP